MPKIYANENAPLPTIRALRALGHEVLTSREAGHANIGFEDERVLEYANEHGMIVLTNNRADFRKLHSDGAKHCGIIEFSVDADFEAVAIRIHTALQEQQATGRFYASITKGGHVFR
jgi:uncharacterized protein with PIN domain